MLGSLRGDGDLGCRGRGMGALPHACEPILARARFPDKLIFYHDANLFSPADSRCRASLILKPLYLVACALFTK